LMMMILMMTMKRVTKEKITMKMKTMMTIKIMATIVQSMKRKLVVLPRMLWTATPLHCSNQPLKVHFFGSIVCQLKR
jgi:hypothetical protein